LATAVVATDDLAAAAIATDSTVRVVATDSADAGVATDLALATDNLAVVATFDCTCGCN